ncbi:MAG: hypothetical protein LBK06_09480 [Planctomycetaceae bacterium]|nr:hypothetical protein [Planctomycetaceae bacterium]
MHGAEYAIATSRRDCPMAKPNGSGVIFCLWYAEAVLKFVKLNTAAQQREAVVQGRSLLLYRFRHNHREVV